MVSWDRVGERLRGIAETPGWQLNDSQRDSLWAIAGRIPNHGLIVADEVGLGKTRIAVALAKAVTECGGRVAILVPPTLGFQWQEELRHGGLPEVPPILRSDHQWRSAWVPGARSREWFDEPVLILSHGFTNWRIHADPHGRTALLPMLAGLARRAMQERRAPGGFDQFADSVWGSIRRASESIAAHCSRLRGGPLWNTFVQLADIDWAPARGGENFQNGGENRKWLHRAVGLGLGAFDLVVVDEAHKSRGGWTELSRLLEETLVLYPRNTRRLCMTATPVELGAFQWVQSLRRAGITETAAASLAINKYTSAVRRVRRGWRTSEQARQDYESAARAYHESLATYVLRRDKRRDEDVQRYQARLRAAGGDATGDADAYRWQHAVVVDAGQLSVPWRQAICAAEALSFVAEMGSDPAAKRLRLTFGNGHGLAAGIDGDGTEEVETVFSAQEEDDAPTETTLEDGAEDRKRRARIDFWKGLIRKVANGPDALFDHPAIVATVDASEAYVERSEKVLVFGRFTEPMRTLVALLNARAMLRALDAGEAWPQRRIAEGDEAAVAAAHRQLGRAGPFDRASIDALLAERYALLENRRERLRRRIFDLIETGLADDEHELRALARAARAADNAAHLVAAIDQLLGERRSYPAPADEGEEFPAASVAEAFADLVTALRERGEGDENADSLLDQAEAAGLWTRLDERLRAEYGTERGRHARLMNGAVDLATRRQLQLGFNRHESNPRILVAQSLVGREGLNLHRACRTVILFHPEWNPGIVEQQIGRVDRVGSHWARMLRETPADQRPPPRIEIRPVIFEGTYDALHWSVLLERWDDLRAQLHGIVVPHRERLGCNDQERTIIHRLDQAAPDLFPPPRKTGWA